MKLFKEKPKEYKKKFTSQLKEDLKEAPAEKPEDWVFGTEDCVNVTNTFDDLFASTSANSSSSTKISIHGDLPGSNDDDKCDPIKNACSLIIDRVSENGISNNDTITNCTSSD